MGHNKEGAASGGNATTRPISRTASVSSTMDCRAVPEDSLQRACFHCYTSAYVGALRLKKEELLQRESTDRPSDSDDILDGSVITHSSGRVGSFPVSEDGVGTCDIAWPIISIAMDTRFKLINIESADLKPLLYLNCRYLRLIRWDGRADD